ncbi:MAG: hypothetical protein HWN81_03530 [Candidatus Lokiarchaeota archaeon]|nr:hypothetical protein [Candidatus Lokiarchaeota archaeon]
MSAELFNIRKYDDSIELSTLIEIYNKMQRYCNPTAMEINEEYASLLLSTNPNFWEKSLIYENGQNEIIGFASIIKLPFFKTSGL